MKTDLEFYRERAARGIRQWASTQAKPLYENVIRELATSGLTVATGEFQATMQVSLVNDGPVTLLLDSRKRF